ncbi:MAG TPA: hypothetical protein VFF06_22560 [Polyangia bacterium]|nr:hypothetical protein [Polyangia bacterium]
MRKLLGSMGAGLVGALVLAGAREFSRRRFGVGKPRLDQFREHQLERLAHALGRRVRGKRLERAVVAGSIAVNAIYFAALLCSGRTDRPLTRGAVGGTLAGLAALVVPTLLRLGKRPRHLTPRNQAVTIGWYTLGGLAAATAWRGLGTRPLIWN